MDKRFKVGILGLKRGRAPLAACKNLSPFFEVTGVMEQNEQVLSEMRPLLPEGTVVYDSYDELIHSGIDAIFLCDYFHEHWRHAIAALDAGVAVFSETTAAPSLGACVDLVEAVERNHGKYMLMANCPYFKPIQLARRKLREGTYGDLIYADAEYVHPVAPATQADADPENLHWRQTLPSCYYNMHSLGPLMYASDSMPIKVIGKAAVHQHPKRPVNTPKIFTITEMDNGAVFNTTGCVSTGTLGKWYRFGYEKGTLETERLQEAPASLVEADRLCENIIRTSPDWVACGALTPEEQAAHGHLVAEGGHGGCDSVMFLQILKYLRGEQEPFFDIYRSVALSAAGILSWYSVLNDSRQYSIPDFHIPAQREQVRGDYRMPFAKRLHDLTLPCRVD